MVERIIEYLTGKGLELTDIEEMFEPILEQTYQHRPQLEIDGTDEAWERSRRAAHTLKGMFRNLGLEEAAERVSKLEKAVSEEDMEQYYRYRTLVDDSLNRFQLELEQRIGMG